MMPSIKYILYFALLSIMFYPVTMGALYCDDALEYLQAPYAHATWLAQSLDLSSKWLHVGRIIILPQFTGSAIDQLSQTIVQYKLILFLINILATISCYVYIKNINNSVNFGLFAFFYWGIIQYHMAFDGYHSFYAYYPILSILIFSCLHFHLRYLKSDQHRFYWASVLLFFLLLLSGEIGLILPFILCIQTYAFSTLQRESILKLIPYYALAGLYLALTYFLRQQTDMQTTYTGIQSNFELTAMIRTWLIQLSASFPLTSLYQRKAILETLLQSASEHWILMTLVCMAYCITIFTFIRNPQKTQPLSNKSIFLFLTIMCLSAAIITPSLKYQSQLHFGLAYLPVMIQYQAFAAILCLVYLSISTSMKRIFLGIFLFIGLITYASNLSEIKKASRINEPFISLKSALKQGLNKQIEEHAIVYYDYFIDLKWFIEPIFNSQRASPIEMREMILLEKDSLVEHRPYYYLKISTGDTQMVELYRLKSINKGFGESIYQFKKTSRL